MQKSEKGRNISNQEIHHNSIQPFNDVFFFVVFVQFYVFFSSARHKISFQQTRQSREYQTRHSVINYYCFIFCCCYFCFLLCIQSVQNVCQPICNDLKCSSVTFLFTFAAFIQKPKNHTADLFAPFRNSSANTRTHIHTSIWLKIAQNVEMLGEKGKREDIQTSHVNCPWELRSLWANRHCGRDVRQCGPHWSGSDSNSDAGGGGGGYRTHTYMHKHLMCAKEHSLHH